MKGVIDLKTKLTSMGETLKQASDKQKLRQQEQQSLIKTPAFLNTIAEVQENLDLIEYQTLKYNKSNAVKKKMIAADVRQKLRALRFNISFLDKMIDALFVHPIIQVKSGNNESEKKGIPINNRALDANLSSAFTQEMQKKINEMDFQLEQLRRQQLDSEEQQLRQQQKLTFESQKRYKGDLRKQEEAQRRQAILNQLEEENKQQKLSIQAENYCFQADCLFFGFSDQAPILNVESQLKLNNIERALELYQNSAELGNPKAMMALGRIYEQGIGTKVDMFKGNQYYDAAAAKNEPYALYWLGKQCEVNHNKNQLFLQTGQHPEMKGQQNMALAHKFYKKAAEKECKEAIYKLGYFLQYGIENEKNLQLAIRKYEEAAAYGHEIAMNALGSLFYNELKDFNQASEWFRKAAERGCARALNNLGQCYEMGHGVEVDMDQALQLYQESSKKGFIPALYNLGLAYLQKAKVTKSQEQYKEAASIFLKVLQKDKTSLDSYFNLGQLFEQGLGVDRDYTTAFHYYKQVSIDLFIQLDRKSAALNHTKSFTKLGDLLYSGKGTQRNKSEAYLCYQKAAFLNDQEAMNNLGLMIEQGFDDKLGDPEQAMEYYKKAQVLGSSDANINVALYYINGLYVERDRQKGRALLKRAYRQGNEKAVEYMINLGFIKHKSELDAEILSNNDDELISQPAGAGMSSSAGFNQYTNNPQLNTIGSKKTTIAADDKSIGWGGVGGVGGSKYSADENLPPQRSSLRSINNNSSKNMMPVNQFQFNNYNGGAPGGGGTSNKSSYYQF